MVVKNNILHCSKNNFAKLIHNKRDFLLKVYGLLALIVMVLIVSVIELHEHPAIEEFLNKYNLYLFIIGFIIIYLFTKHNIHPVFKSIIIILLSIIIGLRCIQFIKIIPKSVMISILISVLILFIITSIIGYTLYACNIKIEFLGIILLYALIALIIAFCVTLFIDIPHILYKIGLICGIMLFSVYIVYNTNMIIQDDYTGDILDGAVQLYLNVFNIIIETGALVF